MKSFMKLIITLLVIASVGYIAYYLIINNSNNNDISLSGDTENNEIKEEISGENVNGGIIFPIKSGEVSGEMTEIILGDNIIEEVIETKEDIIERIDNHVILINSGEILNSISDNLSADLLSDSAREFMNYFKVNELSVTINVKERCVEIIPTSDFIENMVYYYDEIGNLILYESVSNTVGGSTKYYFENGKSIDVIWDYDEDIEKQEEYVYAVLGRAQAIYDKYLKK